MMNENTVSEQFWEILHEAKCLLKGAWLTPLPPLPEPGFPSGAHSGDLSALAKKYQDRLALGSALPPWSGPTRPQILLLSASPLNEGERLFVAKWFENDKVGLHWDKDLFCFSLPSFAGEQPPYRTFFEELCAILSPKAILALGEKPAQMLLGAPLSMTTLRGQEFGFAQWPLLTTWEPAALLNLTGERASELSLLKKQVWADVQRLVGKVRFV